MIGKYIIVPTWAGSPLQVVTGCDPKTGKIAFESLYKPRIKNYILPDDIHLVIPNPPAYKLDEGITTFEMIDNKIVLTDGMITEICFDQNKQEYYYTLFSNKGLFHMHAWESRSVPSCRANRTQVITQ